MVLELAKREYRRLRNRFDDLLVFTPGDATIAPIAVNPLFVLPGCSAVAHIDHLKPLFVAAFGLYGPMPQLLDMVTGTHPLLEAVLDEEVAGTWDDPAFAHLFPILPELSRELGRQVDAAGYQGEILANIKAALLTRLRGMSGGAKGQIYVTHRALDLEDLLHQRVVFELEGLADDADKAFFTGLVLTYIAQWRQLHAPNRQLGAVDGGAQHLLVIEEAHRFLRHEGSARLGEMDANPRAHAIEFFANMLSELRATGQGVIVAEQIPSKIVPDVIKNTATKIVHRLVAEDDQRAMSSTLGLGEADTRYLNELVTGEALVFKEGMGRAAKIRVDAGEAPIRLTEAKLRELMAPLCLVGPDTRTGDMLGRHFEDWDLAALRLLATLAATQADFDLACQRVLAGLSHRARRMIGSAEQVARLLAHLANALLTHGVFAAEDASPAVRAELYRLTSALCLGTDDPAEMLRHWRAALASAWGVYAIEQGAAPRVAELILHFLAQRTDANHDTPALEAAVDHLVRVDAPAFKALVVRMVLQRIGDDR